MVDCVPCLMAGKTKPSATALSSAAAALKTSVAATARMEAAGPPIENIVVTDGHSGSSQMVTCSHHVALPSSSEMAHFIFIPAKEKIRAHFMCYSQNHMNVGS